MSRSARYGAAAAVCAIAAAWLSFSYTGRTERALGAPRTVLVAARPIDRGAGEDEIAAASETHSMPARYMPVDAVTDSADLAGRHLIAAVPAGALLTESLLSGQGTSGGFRLRAGERAVSIDALVSPATTELSEGERVDLYASGFAGAERTEELIAGAEVLAADAAQPGHARLTLRLADAQVAAVVRADVFAHELRAVARPGT